MSEKVVSHQQLRRVVELIEKAGEKPSADKILSITGGSKSTVLRVYEELRTSATSAADIDRQVMHDLIKGFFSDAIAQSMDAISGVHQHRIDTLSKQLVAAEGERACEKAQARTEIKDARTYIRAIEEKLIHAKKKAAKFKILFEAELERMEKQQNKAAITRAPSEALRGEVLMIHESPKFPHSRPFQRGIRHRLSRNNRYSTRTLQNPKNSFRARFGK